MNMSSSLSRNYLRVRGEYRACFWGVFCVWELPPRARRIPRATPPHARTTGTTSACAENTAPPPILFCLIWNYLRVRGEYMRPKALGTSSQELPPRARRILSWTRTVGDYEGTTSACAENTQITVTYYLPKRNYLRVRGEYRLGRFGTLAKRELPPRARRILSSV